MLSIDKDQINRLSSCKIVTIAPTVPKYSEVWMARMNDMLLPDNFFVSLLTSRNDVDGENE